MGKVLEVINTEQALDKGTGLNLSRLGNQDSRDSTSQTWISISVIHRDVSDMLISLSALRTWARIGTDQVRYHHAAKYC